MNNSPERQRQLARDNIARLKAQKEKPLELPPLLSPAATERQRRRNLRRRFGPTATLGVSLLDLAK